jgi:hypothetical protein
MWKKIGLLVGLLSATGALADLSTGRSDAFNLSYGRTTSSDVNVFGHDWSWDLPLYPTSNSAGHLLLGITRWQDNSSAGDSFVGLHLMPVVRVQLPTESSVFAPFLDIGAGVAYFGRKDFGDHYHLDNNYTLEASVLLGANFGQQLEYEVGIAYTHYGTGGGDNVDLLPRVYFGYHF